uniref:ADAM metallopeptidase domain 12 n=1 Tax=Esox lucius TaxID=8010 RepID=A0AAY5JYT8_ESOLU
MLTKLWLVKSYFNSDVDEEDWIQIFLITFTLKNVERENKKFYLHNFFINYLDLRTSAKLLQHCENPCTLHNVNIIVFYNQCGIVLLLIPSNGANVRFFVVQFQKQGKDVERVKQRLAEIANYVDKFFRVLNIRVALVGLEVWSDSDKCPVTQDPFNTLHEFLDWRKVKLLPAKSHDNAQLISGVYFQGTTIGMAPIMSMCTLEQSGGIVMDHSDNPLGAAVTLAHELGHNFGMNHDTPERGCGCRMALDRGGCIMTPSTGYPFPTMFSTCSKKDLAASLEKGVGMCLYNMPEVKVLYGGQKCGNGYVEEGEECDCGEQEECMNPCCNATTCTLKGDAVCAHGQCCEDCRLKPAGTPCRESSNSCDLPEFCTGANPQCPANLYLHDGHACQNMDGYCYNGICQTHEQQCITLWGPAKTAPGICFERVNSAGDPYGNCGKDSKGLFAKCEARHAKCGKIQCQGGANRPVIGTNAVSIETNIPLQEGGRILCRGTHVYLGDDMPDPGLVLSGTKCAEGMICLNRQCQNVTGFGVHQCSGKCNGRGVCNNKKNCHCEAHWAPPFCDSAGFGGSLDSGPMRLAEQKPWSAESFQSVRGISLLKDISQEKVTKEFPKHYV